MLTRLKLKNFKAWREADLQFGRVTGFFGANSAGKSSILQLLLLLKQTRNATDRGLVLDFGEPADMANLGTFKDVVYRHDERKRIGWLLEWTIAKKLLIQGLIGFPADCTLSGNSLQMRSEVGLRQGRPWPYALAYRFDEVDFKLQPKTNQQRKFDLATDNADIKFVRNQGRAWPLSNPIKAYLFPNEIRRFYQNADFLGDFELGY